MSLISEFKEFAVKGNAIDLAVGVIIGAAFGKVVASLTNDMLMPIAGFFLGGTDFSNLKILLRGAVMDGDKVVNPEVAIRYGVFINTILDFLIVTFTIFVVVKVLNAARDRSLLPWHKKDAAQEPTGKA